MADETFALQGRLAVLTGASAGIGEASARRLAALGMDLVLGARRVERLEALAAGLTREHGVRTLCLPLDVQLVESVQSFCEATERFAGEAGVHLLLNNAGLALGLARIPSAAPTDEADWEQMVQTNVLGLLRVTRRLVPGMAARRQGHVINIGSLAGIETYEGGSVYCASKAAVRVLTRALRLELLGTGVRICCINPGMVETEFSLVRLGAQEAADRVYEGMTPLTGDDVARTVAWVASLPAHVNVEELWLHPTDQAAAQKVHRRPAATG